MGWSSMCRREVAIELLKESGELARRMRAEGDEKSALELLNSLIEDE